MLEYSKNTHLLDIPETHSFLLHRPRVQKIPSCATGEIRKLFLYLNSNQQKSTDGAGTRGKFPSRNEIRSIVKTKKSPSKNGNN